MFKPECEHSQGDLINPKYEAAISFRVVVRTDQQR
jgi:hypothetical protein